MENNNSKDSSLMGLILWVVIFNMIIGMFYDDSLTDNNVFNVITNQKQDILNIPTLPPAPTNIVTFLLNIITIVFDYLIYIGVLIGFVLALIAQAFIIGIPDAPIFLNIFIVLPAWLFLVSYLREQIMSIATLIRG